MPPNRDYFETNTYLRELFLGDNPWRCDCKDEEFSDFYSHFMTPYKRIIDRDQTRCVTPDEMYGLTWESACWTSWYPNVRMMSTAEKVWTFLMVSIIVFAGSVCIIMSIKRCIEGRKLTQREEERNRTFEDYRQVRQENQMRILQEAQLNAPNPRETCPPCYEDAILLPRPEGAFSSLDELGPSAKNKSKDDDAPVLRRCRCRSEEVISMRESVRPDQNNRRSSKLVRNTLLQNTTPPSNVTSSPTTERHSTAQTNSTHYHATDILHINNRESQRPAPPSSPPPPPPTAGPGEGSPYSNRRNRISSFRSNGTNASNTNAMVNAEINTVGLIQQNINADGSSTPETSPFIGRNTGANVHNQQPRQRRESDF